MRSSHIDGERNCGARKAPSRELRFATRVNESPQQTVLRQRKAEFNKITRRERERAELLTPQRSSSNLIYTIMHFKPLSRGGGRGNSKCFKLKSQTAQDTAPQKRRNYKLNRRTAALCCRGNRAASQQPAGPYMPSFYIDTYTPRNLWSENDTNRNRHFIFCPLYYNFSFLRYVWAPIMAPLV